MVTDRCACLNQAPRLNQLSLYALHFLVGEAYHAGAIQEIKLDIHALVPSVHCDNAPRVVLEGAARYHDAVSLGKPHRHKADGRAEPENSAYQRLIPRVQ